jgi:hypothetical protein
MTKPDEIPMSAKAANDALKRMKDLTKRIVAVPKSEVDEVQADYEDKPTPKPA